MVETYSYFWHHVMIIDKRAVWSICSIKKSLTFLGIIVISNQGIELLMTHPTSEPDPLAFHYIPVPRIDHHLSVWKEGYLHHQIRTAGNRTPMQLYILGLLQMRGSMDLSAYEVNNWLEEVSCIRITEITVSNRKVSRTQTFNCSCMWLLLH